MKANLTSLVAVGLLALGAAACGSSSKATAPPPTTQSSSVTTPTSNPEAGSATTTSGGVTPTSAGAGAKSGHIGDTLSVTDIGGDTVTVTLVRLIDPGTSSSAANQPSAGDRWVAFEATITDAQEMPGNDSVGAVATGSDGKSYNSNPDITGEVTGCTPTAAAAKAGDKATFCPGFDVPSGVTLTRLGYSVAGSDIGAAPTLTWSIP